ncbi:TIGR03085 family metal-binding protein [Nocardioides limicola]|uniref:TIGR03085 family metal-binding protein n=1 Tax=Nocardioides limicola TaxID=2803368 RepID=UPI00193BE5DA|nr:TIGR03085 family metal-binding protein [Nocardioides sp. DJM-14]
MASFARTERDQLCSLALELGGSAPTLCEGWDVKDLVVHLMVRERTLLGAPGIVVPSLESLTEGISARMARADLPLLVDQLRRPKVTWAALGPVDRLVNTVEFFVHHEDLRRAQPGWRPRELSPSQQSTLWRALATGGRMLLRKAGVPLQVVDSGSGREFAVRRGEEPVVVRGLPSELLLFAYGRGEHADVEISGPGESVRRLREATLGI